ncbi:hypothetical protein GCM10022408_06840 [Hymenobacter fastidiosus]|uniref:Transposase IS4-like domain-containing protein n=1 Tax=Hymenobacter fastidiosus TaxID=486264 RepID=A0ABP7RJS9_9BACT
MHAAADALGNPVYVHFSGGQEADGKHFERIIESLPTEVKAVVGDKGYDTNAVVERMEEHEAEVVVPSKKNCTTERVIDKNLYQDRNKVERFS